MVDQTIEIIIGAIFSFVMVCSSLALGYMVYLSYCQKSSGPNSSGCHLDKTKTVLFVMPASETSESHQKDQASVIVSLLYEYGVK